MNVEKLKQNLIDKNQINDNNNDIENDSISDSDDSSISESY